MKQKRIHLIHRKRSPFPSRGRRSLLYPFQLLDLVAQERRMLEFEQL